MYQDQNQYSIDYLNQIAPQPQRNPGRQKWLVIGLILGVLSVVVLALSVFASLGGAPTRDLATLSARLTSLQEITASAQPNIKNGQLRSTNSNLSIFFTNTNRDIVEHLQRNDIKPDKIDKSIVASEAYTEMKDSIENARLNATFDSVYVREMNLRLAELTSLMARIHGTTRSSSMKEFLTETNTSLQAIRKQYQAVSEDSMLQ